MASSSLVCRLCMSSVGVSISVFECPTGRESYSEQISSMFQIELAEKLWSSLACRSCVLVLDETRQLKRKVIATQEHLLLLESQVKQEVATQPEKSDTAVVDQEEADWAQDSDSPPDRDSDYAPEHSPSPPPKQKQKKEDEEDWAQESDASTGRDHEYVPEDFPSPTPKEEQDGEEKVKPLVMTRRTARQLKIAVPEVVDVSRSLEKKERKQLATVSRKRKKRKSDSSDEDEEWDEGKDVKKISVDQREQKPKRKSVKELREILLPLDKMMVEMGLLECPKCQERAETFHALHSHMMKRHKKTGYIACCDSRMGPKQAYDHMRYHLNKDLFKCDVCQRVCTNGPSLKLHKERHITTENIAHCEICGKGFQSQKRLRKHLRTHTAEQDRAFQCQRCPRGFYTKSMLSNHVKSQHEKDANAVCEICGKGYATQSALKDHIKRHAESQTEACDICGKYFSNVRLHKKRIHEEHTKIPCAVCGKQYTKLNMSSHIRDFHTLPPRQCPHCPKEFYQAITYQNHLNVHLGIKIQCRFCPLELSDSGNMYKHMNQHHPVEYAAYKAKKNSEQTVRNGMK